MACAEVHQALEDMEWHTPFAGRGDTWDAESVCGVDVADDCLRVGEGDYVACGDDVVDTYEGCAIAVGYDGEGVGADVRGFFDGFRLHVAVADCGAGRCGSDVVLPFGVRHKEAAWRGSHHCPAVEDCIGSSGEVCTSWTMVWAQTLRRCDEAELCSESE